MTTQPWTTPRASYVVPFWRLDATPAELTQMAADFDLVRAAGFEVVVADGSPPAAFERHAAAFAGRCRHIGLDRRWRYANGKVNGVLSGIAAARAERIVLADDDVAYDADALERLYRALEDADLVVPQNFFRPLPWWARIESGRILLNRACRPAGDYPGTFALRRSTFERIGPYDGDVLFENEELRRHFLRHGARVRHARDLLVARRPPTLRKWREQRLRQAYEDLDNVGKTVAFFALLPVALLLAGIGGTLTVTVYAVLLAVSIVALAWRGRRDGAGRVMPATLCLWAPLWVLERAISVHRAVAARVLHGGCEYGGRRIQRSVGQAVRAGAVSATSAEALLPVVHCIADYRAVLRAAASPESRRPSGPADPIALERFLARPRVIGDCVGVAAF